MNTVKNLILSGFLLVNLAAFSQGKNLGMAKITLTKEVTSEQMPDSIVVRYWLNEQESNARPIFKSAYAKGSSFTFEIPIENSFTRFDVVFRFGPTSILTRSQRAKVGDSVLATFNLNDKVDTQLPLKVINPGNDRYILVEELGMETDDFTSKLLKYGKEGRISQKMLSKISLTKEEIKEDIDFKDSLAKSSEIRAEKIFDKYRIKLSPSMLNFYMAEYLVGRKDFFIYANYSYPSLSKMERKWYAEYCLTKTNNFRDFVLSGEFEESEHFYSFNKGLNMSIRAHLLAIANEKNLTFKDRYNELKQVNETYIREKLITHFIINPVRFQTGIEDFESADSCINDALTFFKDPIFKSLIYDKIILKKGGSVFDFSFQDEKGTPLGLKDLKGKVFMIDFYGTGCTGCAQFHAQFDKEIYPKFSMNKNFAVVSVNVDNSRERWNVSRMSGLYTKESYINLWTGKIGMNNPMLNFYKVHALPFILLIDKNGNVISKLYNGMSSDSIAEMIRHALDDE